MKLHLVYYAKRKGTAGSSSLSLYKKKERMVCLNAGMEKSLGKYGLVKSNCEIPTIKDDEVLVKVLATGICGTDFGIYKGYREVEEGLIPGHEFIGEIVETGASVTGYEAGDRVVPSIVKKCGKCPACIQGFEAQCENLQEIGIHIDGSFAE